LPSGGSAAILAVGSGTTLAFRPLDDNLTEWAGKQNEAAYTAAGRVLGDGWVQGGAALATYGLGLAAGHGATTHVGSDLIRAQALNAIMTRVAKIGVGRKRPGGSPDSMPSGHASATFASAAVLGSHFGWKVGVPAYAAAGFVGWTRVRDQRHWATDVVMGAAVGLIAGHTVTRGHGNHSWIILPVASGTSASVLILKKI
jgi:membrane-associated phospholipid phosphatase